MSTRVPFMNSMRKITLAMLMLGVVAAGLILSGCSSLKHKSPETLSRQDRDSAAVIERQEANGDSTSTEAAIEKDSLKRNHLIQF
jgi:outer membrane murein-binding lipoprotein Lpp